MTSLGDKIRAVAEFNDRPMEALAREADALENRIKRVLEVEPHENYPGQEAVNDWDLGFNQAILEVRATLEADK